MSILAPLIETPSLKLIMTLYPPGSMVEIAPSSAQTIDAAQAIDATHMLLIDNVAERAELTQSKLPPSGKIILKHAILSAQGGEQTFYTANLPKESGLIRPELLQGLWQNIATLSEHIVATTTLDDLLIEHGLTPNWVLIDDLLAIEILKGGLKSLETVDVIIARTVLNAAVTPDLSTRTKQELDAFLFSKGFLEFSLTPERQPNLAKIIYIRDWKHILTEHGQTQLEALNAATLLEQKKTGDIETLQAQLSTKSDELSQAHQATHDLTEKNNQIQTELETLQAQLSTKSDELSQAHQATHDLTEKNNQIQTELETLVEAQKVTDNRLNSLNEATHHADQAEKKQKLSENNLANMRTKYKKLADAYAEQSSVLEAIQAQLQAASNFFRDDTTAAKDTPRKK